jgi:regulatory protein
VRASALDILARRDRPSPELRHKLAEQGFAATVVADVVERLIADKLVDDRRFVENFIGFRAARGQGPGRIRADLRQVGLAGEMVEEGVAAYGDWALQLERARQKKFGAKLPRDYADRQRQARFLGYRGYTGSQIRLALGVDIDNDADDHL